MPTLEVYLKATLDLSEVKFKLKKHLCQIVADALDVPSQPDGRLTRDDVSLRFRVGDLDDEPTHDVEISILAGLFPEREADIKTIRTPLIKEKLTELLGPNIKFDVFVVLGPYGFTEQVPPKPKRIPTNEELARFVGGEFEVQCQLERYLYRSRIKSVRIADGELTVESDWVAKNDGGPLPHITRQWTLWENKPYCATISETSWKEPEKDRWIFSYLPFPMGELCVLIAPNGSRMDPRVIDNFPPEFFDEQLTAHNSWNDSR